jgi:hypothetical protein
MQAWRRCCGLLVCMEVSGTAGGGVAAMFVRLDLLELYRIRAHVWCHS